MAAPITHIILALKIFTLLPATIDKKAFIVGTCFPDIRYIAKIDRKKTHIEPVCWQDVKNEPSSFRAGLLFHNLVDNLRIKHFEPFFWDRTKLSQYSPSYIKLYPLIMKFAEDSILYPKSNQWHEIVTYFDTIYEEERAFSIPEAIILSWHNYIKNYLKQAPTLTTINAFCTPKSNMMLNTHEDIDVANTYNGFLNNQDFKNKLINFYDTFETLLH